MGKTCPRFVCEQPPMLLRTVPSQPPSPLLPAPNPYSPLHDPGQRSFSNISLERLTKVFSLVLLSCDQSIAQEMGSLESCLSKISYFTGWSILRAHSAPSLPRANISVTWVVGARRRPHILCLVKGHISLYAPVHPHPWPAWRSRGNPDLVSPRTLSGSRQQRLKDKKL